MLSNRDAMRFRQAVKEQRYFLARLFLVLIGVEDESHTQTGVHESPEDHQNTHDGGKAQLAGLKNHEPVNVPFEPGKYFGEETALRSVKLDRTYAGFLAVDYHML